MLTASRWTLCRSLHTVLLVLLALSLFACASNQVPKDEVAARGEAHAIARRGGVTVAESGSDFLSRGAELLAEGRDSEAMAQFIRAYIDTDRSIDSQTAIAWLQLRHDHRIAEAMFTSIVDEEPEKASHWYGLGVARLLGDDVDGAFGALERSLELEPNSVDAAIAMASVAVARGEMDRAVEFALRANRLDAHSIEAENALGYILMLRGDLAEAEVHLRGAVSGAPGNVTFGNNLGTCLAMAGRHSEAFSAFSKSGEQQHAYNNLAMILMNEGLQEKAILLFEHALLFGGEADLTVLKNLRRAAETALSRQ